MRKSVIQIFSLIFAFGLFVMDPTIALASCAESGICAPGYTCDVTNDPEGICVPGSTICRPGLGIDLAACLQLRDGTQINEKYTDASFLVNLIVTNLFVFAGIILFFLIIVAGFKFITGGKKGVDEAKTLITTAITGFVIMFSAYWIVQIVELLTGAAIPI